MAIAHRCLDEMHVEATGCRDRHQGVAARDAHRDRLENLAGVNAEGPGLGDRGVGLLVRDGLERDGAAFRATPDTGRRSVRWSARTPVNSPPHSS